MATGAHEQRVSCSVDVPHKNYYQLIGVVESKDVPKGLVAFCDRGVNSPFVRGVVWHCSGEHRRASFYLSKNAQSARRGQKGGHIIRESLEGRRIVAEWHREAATFRERRAKGRRSPAQTQGRVRGGASPLGERIISGSGRPAFAHRRSSFSTLALRFRQEGRDHQGAAPKAALGPACGWIQCARPQANLICWPGWMMASAGQ